MALSVKKVSLWRGEGENKPGMLARCLEPLADVGADLEIVMSYAMGDRGIIEVAPITGKRAVAAAEKARLRESRVPALLVTGDNRTGVGHAMAQSIAGSGINVNFLVAQVIGNRFTSVFGFESEADADRAIPLIKAAGAPQRTRAGKARQERIPIMRT